MTIERYRFIGEDICNLCGTRSAELKHSPSGRESSLRVPTPICADCGCALLQGGGVRRGTYCHV